MFLVGEQMGGIDGWQICFKLFALAVSTAPAPQIGRRLRPKALGLLAQMCVVIAMQKETGGTVSVVLYAQVRNEPRASLTPADTVCGDRPIFHHWRGTWCPPDHWNGDHCQLRCVGNRE